LSFRDFPQRIETTQHYATRKDKPGT
jgi:hypothetical protein